MFKRTWLLAFAGLGLISAQACSDDTTPGPSGNAGSGGRAGAAGHSGSAGRAGSAPVAGTTNGEAGQAGSSTNEAGAAGTAGSSEYAGEAGIGGETSGGSGGTGGTGGNGGTAGAGGSTSTFTVQSTALGQVVATTSGMTLYVFNTDTPGNGSTAPVSSCTSSTCMANWPIYYGTVANLPPSLQASDFGSFDRNGTPQSTYKGWPLYTYASDTAVGDVKGEGLGSGKWYSSKLPFTTPGATTFTLQTTSIGTVIGTANGLSLYVFKSDTPATGSAPPVSACGSGCLSSWPLYNATLVSVPLGLLASDFGSFDRGGAVFQSTYKGWPLYTYVGDSAPGNVTGEGLSNVWYTAKSPFVAP